jgi:hypothetical protein
MRNILKYKPTLHSSFSKYHELGGGDRKFVTKQVLVFMGLVITFATTAVTCRWRMLRLASAICIVATAMCANTAFAQAIDSVDVARSGNEAEITVRFVTQIQYLRHAPPDSGRSLRVYVRITGPGIQPADLMPETTRLPKVEYLPQFSVTYPESDGAMLITFDRPVSFLVRPAPDGRSVSVKVPVLPGS